MHEVLLDCLVYAPLGAAIVVFEEVPRLAERGRERVDKQVAIARLLGRFAVREGQRRLRPPGSSSPRGDAASPDPHAAPPDPQGEAAEGSTEPAVPVPEAADSGGTEELLDGHAVVGGAFGGRLRRRGRLGGSRERLGALRAL